MKTVFFILCCVACLSAGAQKIYGKITFNLIGTKGNRPDSGARVTAVDSSLFPQNFYADVNNIQMAGDFREKTHGLETDMKKFTNQDLQQIQQYNLEPYIRNDSLFNAFDDSLARTLIRIVRDNRSHSVKTDQSGKYAIPVQASTYYVLIQSRGRKGQARINVAGRVDIENIIVEPGKNFEVDHKFDL